MLKVRKGRIISSEKGEIREEREARGLRCENNWGRMCRRGKME